MVGGYTNNNKYAVKLPSTVGSSKTPTIDTSYKTNLGGNLTSPVIGLGSSKLPTKIPTSVTAPSIKMPSITNQFNGSVVRVGAGGVGGGSSGGVTKEGVIIGGGAVNSTFNNISSGKKTTGTDLSYGANAGVNTLDKSNSLLESLKSQTNTQPITQPTTKPAAPQQPTTPPEQTEEHIDTYEEFIQKTKDTHKENLDKTNQLIDEQKQAALESAETARQRSIADARSSYEQNKATYGANAEALAGMGLSGSGYSDYINAQAYAQQRGDVQNANAVAAAERTAAESEAGQKKLSAELSYSENIAKADEALIQYKQQESDKKDSYYANLINYANNGTYTAEQLAQLGAQYGLSNEQLTTLQQAAAQYKTDKNNAYYTELLSYANNGSYTADQLSQLGTSYGLDAAQIKSLTDAATKYTENKQNANYNQLSSNFAGSVDYLESAKKNGDISETQYGQLVEMYQKTNYEQYSSDVTSGIADTSAIDRAFKNGDISETQYNTLKSEWNKNVDTSASFFNYNGSSLDYGSAKEAYEAVIKNSWCNEATKKAITDTYYKTYAVNIGKELLGGKVSDGANTVNINSGYSSKQWGDFNGIDKTSDWQYTYAQKVVDDAKAGKIAVGQVVTMNVGSVWSDYGCYVYVGNGMFVKCECSSWSDPQKTYGDKLYIPDGYKIGGANKSIQRK